MGVAGSRGVVALPPSLGGAILKKLPAPVTSAALIVHEPPEHQTGGCLSRGRTTEPSARTSVGMEGTLHCHPNGSCLSHTEGASIASGRQPVHVMLSFSASDRRVNIQEELFEIWQNSYFATNFIEDRTPSAGKRRGRVFSHYTNDLARHARVPLARTCSVQGDIIASDAKHRPQNPEIAAM